MIPKRRPFIPKKKETEHRLNRDIRVPEVRLVGEEIEPGVYPIEEALRLAKEQEEEREGNKGETKENGGKRNPFYAEYRRPRFRI